MVPPDPRSTAPAPSARAVRARAGAGDARPLHRRRRDVHARPGARAVPRGGLPAAHDLPGAARRALGVAPPLPPARAAPARRPAGGAGDGDERALPAAKAERSGVSESAAEGRAALGVGRLGFRARATR